MVQKVKFIPFIHEKKHIETTSVQRVEPIKHYHQHVAENRDAVGASRAASILVGIYFLGLFQPLYLWISPSFWIVSIVGCINSFWKYTPPQTNGWNPQNWRFLYLIYGQKITNPPKKLNILNPNSQKISWIPIPPVL